jgi:flagellar protein FliS
MRVNFKALESYGAGSAATQAAVANKVELIQMLFDGLLDSLMTAHGHIERNAIEEKAKCLARANRIVFGLQSALDFEKGGDLAKNLNELYSYTTRRLLHINVRNDLTALREVHGLMSEVREAWRQVPSLLPASALSSHH